MMQQTLMFIISLALLCLGANLLVKGSVQIAKSVGVSGLVVGLTIVSLGTSAPELFISVIASINGNADLAIGNIVGSNMANIGLVMALTALVRPIGFRKETMVRRDFYFMTAITFFAAILMWHNSTVGRFDGLVLVLFLCLYLFKVVSGAKERRALRRNAESPVNLEAETGLLVSLAYVALGIFGLSYGSSLLRETVVYLGAAMGVSELFIAVTMVSVGTSLPELATSITAALKKESGLAIGNIVGSNIFNLTFVLGTTSILAPLDVSSEILSKQYALMTFITLVLLGLAWANSRLSQRDGCILVCLYLVIIGLM